VRRSLLLNPQIILIKKQTKKKKKKKEKNYEKLRKKINFISLSKEKKKENYII
jgi:hypothetical protein